MNYKPSIYCSSALLLKISADSINTDFWEIQSENPNVADVLFTLQNDTIHVQGMDKTFALGSSLSELLNQISPLDFSYLQELFPNEVERSEMIELVKVELSKNLDELFQAVLQENPEAINRTAHKLHSKLQVLGIPVGADCRFIEQNAAGFHTAEFQDKFFNLKMHCLIRLSQIQ